MAAPLRILVCVSTLTALSAPWAAVAATGVHLMLDHHHSEAAGDHGALHHVATVLHGHRHDDGTPAHSHDATVALAASLAPMPSVTTHPAIAAVASLALAAGAAVLDRFDSSPPQRVPIILRI